MTGNAAIWRATNSTNTEPSGSGADKVEFDVDSVVPDGTGHFNNTEFEINSGMADNEKAFQDVNEAQFTRVETVTLQLSGHIQDPQHSGASAKLKVWELEDLASDLYPRGRFGLRVNDFPIFNIKPVVQSSGNARGGAISNVKFFRSEIKNRVDFVLTFKITGDLKTNTGTKKYGSGDQVSDIYDWS